LVPGTVCRLEADAPSHEAVSVIAEGGTAQARVWHILDAHDVSPDYPDVVFREVAEHLARPGLDDASLTDLTDLAFITIDNEDSRDLDQAMYIMPHGQGYRIYYALADAAYYVAPGSALFAEALARGASYYLPEMSVPMLPPALSEGLISLNPNVARRALVFVIDVDDEAVVVATRLERARICSRAKLSYDGVQAFHDAPQTSGLGGHDYSETLQLLRVVGDKRIALARQRNVVEYARRSLEVHYADDSREHFEISDDPRLASESWNEQISLLCNYEGAKLLMEEQAHREIQPVFRVHEPPNAERLKKFSRLLNRLIDAHGLSREVWVWRWRDGSYGDQETIAHYLRRLPRDAETDAVRRAITHQAQMLNNASVFTAVPGPHHSLKLDGYARFSSPMREVAGIFTHKEILEFCTCGDVPPAAVEDDLALREQVIEAANRARSVQKKLTKAVYKLAIDDLFEADLAQPLDARPERMGTVYGVRPSRVYVRLDEPAIDVKLYADALEAEHDTQLTMERSQAVLSSPDDGLRFVVGARLRLRVVRYDSPQERWILQPRTD